MTMTLAAARRVFFWAGAYGVVVLLPQYFLEERIGRDFPPAITHPEHFYGFVGAALAWQFAFFLIARDVVRHRIFMVPAALEKVLFAIAVFVLHFQGRVSAIAVGFAAFDLLLAGLFLWAFFAVGKASRGLP